MKVRRKLLLQIMEETAMNNEMLARNIGVDVSEIKMLFAGEAVGIKTARKFIYYFGADDAQRLIDWEAIGKKNPLADEIKKQRSAA